LVEPSARWDGKGRIIHGGIRALDNQKSWFEILKFKVIFCIILGAVLYFGSGLLGFPQVFQIMFSLYALLGFIVFVLLDMPPMKPITGGKALVGIVVFFIVCSLVLTAGSNLLPQYDPAWEQGKIKKILKRRVEKFSRTTVHDLYAQAEELTKKADQLLVRLENLDGGGGIDIVIEIPEDLSISDMTPEQRIAYGKEVYDLYECYNCHKLKGKGAAKKRGPKMDNLGNVMTKDEIKEKIWDPTIGYSEGFEKEHKKETMPDNYSELMDEGELDVLTDYLITLKNTRVKTPKLIYHDHSKHKD